MGLIDTDRFRESFEQYASIGATERGGLHRLALSEADRRVRETFVSDLEELGLSVRIDELGNIFGRRSGTDDAAPVLIGSHLDSQPKGGQFDGQLGVLSALETLRAFEANGVETKRPIEIVNWTNEEGARFKPALMGSGTFAGTHDLDTVLAETDSEGTTVAEALDEIGYRGADPVGPSETPHAALELHVEQGPVLEESDRQIGVVEGVLGMSWLEATIYGDSDHAGPSPMHTRSDALVATADVVTAVRRLANRLGDDVVTTVGELSIEPNSVNVIPAESRFTVDVRSYDDETVLRGVERVEQEIQAACEREGTEYDLAELWRIPHTEFAPVVADAVEAAAIESDHSSMRMISGAGHDASYLAELTDTGMIFVPSVDGQTHNEREWTEWDDAVAGAEVFARTTRRLAEGVSSDGGR
ncbi:Zn-dependent hydrolase (plasmid) [Haloferacaceae archaeon DSL9]